ncbi:MAG: 30S ribosomal protein S8e [Candidatus Aenigmarchaeota archaeon]|nr:30S ribosomal protein S8e [Candidatus Aenigmarchaeota archaeon]
MAIAVKRSNRKYTGGAYNKLRKKKKRDFGTDFFAVKIGEIKSKSVKTLGGNTKQKLRQIDKVSVADPETGKAKLVKIITVKENRANPNYVRMNIMTKGAVVDTELGLVKITSKPGQHGVMNGVLVKK